jgi:hypothetical protein
VRPDYYLPIIVEENDFEAESFGETLGEGSPPAFERMTEDPLQLHKVEGEDIG